MAEGFQVVHRTPDGQSRDIWRPSFRRIRKRIRTTAPGAIRAAQARIVMDQAIKGSAILEDARQESDRNLNEFISDVEHAHWARAIQMQPPEFHFAQSGLASGSQTRAK